MAQLEVFHALMQAARYTEWGRKYDYSSITDPDRFRERGALAGLRGRETLCGALAQG